MRISKEMFAAGLLAFTGALYAAPVNPADVHSTDNANIANDNTVNDNTVNDNTDTSLTRSGKKKHVKPHVKVDANDKAQEASAQDGRDARASYEDEKGNVKQDVREIKQDAKETARDIKEGAQDVAQDAGESAVKGVRQGSRGLSQAIREGSDAVAGSPSALPPGELGSGKRVRNTITTDPLGTALGAGLNAEYSHGVGSKFAVVGGARFARTYAAADFVTNFGVRLGADYFVLGRDNEGLRIGPRVDLSLGNVSGGGQLAAGEQGTAFRDFGAGAELGYNWIATNGITAGAAAGLMGHTSSATTNEVRIAGGSFGPYGKINLGYSW